MKIIPIFMKGKILLGMRVDTCINYHIAIMHTQGTTSVSENFQEIEQIRKLAVKAIGKLGTDQYVLKYHADGKLLEILPEFIENGKIDLLKRIKRTITVFEEEQDLNIMPSRTSTANAISRLIATLRSAMIGQSNCVEYAFFSWDTEYINIKQAVKFLSDNSDYGKEVLAGLPIPNTFKAKTHTCPFDNQTVIESQLILESRYFNVIINHRPYLPYHFLITPKRCSPYNASISKDNHDHVVESWEFMSSEMADEAYQIFAVLSRIISHLGKHKVVGFIQNGSSAGQTVPHTHMHVLLPPCKDHYFSRVAIEIMTAAKGLQAEQFDSKEYVNNMRKEVGVLLYQSLAMSKIPRTLLLSPQSVINKERVVKKLRLIRS